MTDQRSDLLTASLANEDQWNRLNSARELIEHETRLLNFQVFSGEFQILFSIDRIYGGFPDILTF